MQTIAKLARIFGKISYKMLREKSPIFVIVWKKM